jgi:hypothetical protein
VTAALVRTNGPFTLAQPAPATFTTAAPPRGAPCAAAPAPWEAMMVSTAVDTRRDADTHRLAPPEGDRVPPLLLRLL